MARTPDPTTKIALLRAAEEVFAAHGLVNAKVEEITRRAGTSKGAFYLHFASKEEAFKQVAESFLARLSGAFPAPADLAVPSDPRAALALWLRMDEAIYEFLWRNRAIVAILQGCQGEHEYLLEAFRAEIQERVVSWVRVWKKKGIFRRDLDEDLAATLINGAHEALCKKTMGADQRPFLARVVRDAQGIFVRAFGARALIETFEQMENAPVSRAIQNDARRRRMKASGS